MNYACMTGASVCTNREVVSKKKLSQETKARRDFIRNHDFSIEADPSGKCEIKITKRAQNG